MIYEKTALEGYTKIGEIIEWMDEAFLKRASAPYVKGQTAQKQAERLIDLIEKKKRLIDFYYDIKEATESLKEEHRLLLREKYGVIEPMNIERNRNYFRKLLLATDKFGKAMEERGYDETKYKKLIKEFFFLSEIYARRKAKEEACRKRGVLHNFTGVSLVGSR